VPIVENMQLREIGSDFVAEADFLTHRISVRCVYDAANWCWVPNVFLIAKSGLLRLSNFSLRLRASSRLSAAHLGMQFAVTQLLLDEAAANVSLKTL
jgi:hypothetical protein